MKCAIHPEVDAVGYCRNCGKALCPTCSREVRGMVYCEACLASPALATILGFVPGLGAVYNGEFTKAIIHVLVFATLVAIESGDHPDSIHAFLGIMIVAFIFYMAIDANRSARARMAGTTLADPLAGVAKGKAVLPFVLIALGVLYLLRNFDVINVDRLIDTWWPMILIAVGAFLAWRRLEDRA
jgi:hypothetical protein